MKHKKRNSIKDSALFKLWAVSEQKYMVFLQLAFKVYLSLAAIYVSQLARRIVDENVFLKQPVAILLQFAVILLLGVGVSYLYQYCTNTYSIGLSYRLRNMGMERLTRCSYGAMGKEHSGAIINRMVHDISDVAGYISGSLSEFMGSMITFTCCFIYLLFVNWQMLLTCSVCIPITLFVTKRLAAPTYQTMEQFDKKMDEIGAMAKDTLMNQKTEKVFQLKQARRKVFDETMDEATAHYVEYERLVAKASPVRYLLNAAPTLICIMVGFVNSYFGRITGGEFVSVILLLDYIAKPLAAFIGYITDYKMAEVSMHRVLEILEYPLEESGEEENNAQDGEFCYCFNGLTFGYDETAVLQNLNLRIPCGKMTAIVGESGSGKSTLFQLLLGFYQPWEGSIEMYGRDVRKWNLEALRREVAYVEQTPYLFNGTVKENIRAGRENATDEEIMQAARLAYAHEFIMELPEGYDTRLSEGGKNLSGGQRQRLAIARAFLKEAPILLLDEMTSALDNESQRLIRLAIDRYRKNRTVLVIAHRLQSVVTAENIVVMEKGRAVECGTHAELLAKAGIYARLYRMGECE